MQKWNCTPFVEVFRAKVFRYLKTTVTSPRTLEKADFDIIQCASWVNVVALDEAGKLILVHQYRAGSDSITIETAAGAINYKEDPLAAAKRELEEETAYTSNEWESLGIVDVNPAIMTNQCYFFLARNCKRNGTLNFDPMEEVETHLYSKDEVRILLKNQKINHSLSVLALMKFFTGF